MNKLYNMFYILTDLEIGNKVYVDNFVIPVWVQEPEKYTYQINNMKFTASQIPCHTQP